MMTNHQLDVMVSSGNVWVVTVVVVMMTMMMWRFPPL